MAKHGTYFALKKRSKEARIPSRFGLFPFIMTYTEKLKHPNWQKRRLEVLNRDDFTCQECLDKNKTLHVHHLTYEYGRDPWDYPLYYFVTLCEDCHLVVEENKKVYENDILKSFRLNFTNEFMRKCVQSVFNGFSSMGLHAIFLRLWELGEDNSIEAMQQYEKLRIDGKNKNDKAGTLE